MEKRSGEAPGETRLLILSFSALGILALIPVASVFVIPFDDYHNHLARMWILANGRSDPFLSKFYAVHWDVIPNLAMDVLVPPLVKVFGLFSAGKIFYLAAAALIVTGVHAINRSLYGVRSVWPLVAFLFIHNGVFDAGVMNYMFGVGLALWGVAAWIGLRQRRPAIALLISSLFIVSLFLCHLFAVGLYGLAVLCFEAWRRRTKRTGWGDLLVPILPFIFVPLLMAISPTTESDAGATAGLAGTGILSIGSLHWLPSTKIEGLTNIVHMYNWRADLAIGAVIATAGLWAVLTGRLRIHAAGWYLIVISLPIYILMPTDLFGSWGADIRYPIALLFVIIGFSRWQFSESPVWAPRLFCSVVLALFVAETGVVESDWRSFSEVQKQFRDSFAVLPRGSRVLITKSNEKTPLRWSQLTRLYNVPCLAVVDRSALVSDLFAMKGHTVVRINSPYREATSQRDDTPPITQDVLKATPSDAVFYKNWDADYDYLYVIPTLHGWDPHDPRLRLVYEGDVFQLYRIDRPGAPNSG